MEENRLKAMPAYDQVLFNSIYKKTLPLKRKLASQIDCRRFGVERQEVLSWFDVKILFVFQKHHQNLSPDSLLAMTIRSLQFFKCRILRKAYTPKFSQSIVEYDYDLHDVEDTQDDLKSHYSKLLRDFMQKTLSEEAYCLFELRLDPPPYILRKLKKKGIDSLHKIPKEIILKYFDMKLCPNSYQYLDLLDQEIKKGINLAKYHFASN